MAESKYNEGKHGDEVDHVANNLSKITVVEHENARTKAISYFPKEVKQVCKDIASFFKTCSEGSKKVAVIGPQALGILLESVDDPSEVWFYEYRLLDVDAIENLGILKPSNLIPFAENIDGDFLATGEHDHKGGVFCVSADGEIEGEEEARSFATYLEKYHDALLSHKLEFIEDVGMVETESSTTKK